jgi:hypothetical protein
MIAEQEPEMASVGLNGSNRDGGPETGPSPHQRAQAVFVSVTMVLLVMLLIFFC